MERLQEAIKKAREQRDGSGSPEEASTEGVRAESSGDSTATAEAWAALKPFARDIRALHKNRVLADEAGAVAAPYDMLRTKLLQQAALHGWRRIAITSPDVGAGKSTTMANLAFSLERQHDTPTLVLDFDLRHGGLSKLLGQRVSHSMGDVLRGNVSFSDHALRLGDKLAFGLNNGPVKHPSELLQSRQTIEFLDRLEETFAPGLVLFDMPPMMASDDTVGFFKNVDAAVIVAAAEKTSMDRIDVAERQVAELTNVMGIVLNKCRYVDGAYGYEYGHY